MDRLAEMASKGNVKAQDILEDIKATGEPAPHNGGGAYYNTAGCVGTFVKKGTFARVG